MITSCGARLDSLLWTERDLPPMQLEVPRRCTRSGHAGPCTNHTYCQEAFTLHCNPKLRLSSSILLGLPDCIPQTYGDSSISSWDSGHLGKSVKHNPCLKLKDRGGIVWSTFVLRDLDCIMPAQTNLLPIAGPRSLLVETRRALTCTAFVFPDHAQYDTARLKNTEGGQFCIVRGLLDRMRTTTSNHETGTDRKCKPDCQASAVMCEYAALNDSSPDAGLECFSQLLPLTS